MGIHTVCFWAASHPTPFLSRGLPHGWSLSQRPRTILLEQDSPAYQNQYLNSREPFELGTKWLADKNWSQRECLHPRSQETATDQSFSHWRASGKIFTITPPGTSLGLSQLILSESLHLGQVIQRDKTESIGGAAVPRGTPSRSWLGLPSVLAQPPRLLLRLSHQFQELPFSAKLTRAGSSGVFA